MEIINCKKLSQELRDNYKEIIKSDLNITLVVIMIGENQASNVYVRNKEKACEYVGIKTKTIKLPENILESDVIELIHKLNEDKNVTGVMVQLPISEHLDAVKICNEINPLKDVDGLTYTNTAKLWTSTQHPLVPCTPRGIIKILNTINFRYRGAKAVVIGRSNIVGLPIAKLLLNSNCTVTMCHSKSNLFEACLNADLIISAIGKPKYLNNNIIYAPNAVIIDVGINRDENGKLCGDVDIDNITCKAITPVPGGVGLLTVTMLLYNVIIAYFLQNEKNTRINRD